MNVTVKFTGVEELDDALSYLADKSAKRIGKSAATKMASVYAKAIRRFVPSSIAPSTPDRGIGSRGDRAKQSQLQTAKAGIGVGKANKKARELTIVNRGRHKGVGVSARNLHWFALGTGDRFTGQTIRRNRKTGRSTVKATGNPRHFTGRIDKAKFGGFVQAGVLASELPAIAEARKVVDRKIAAEVEKARSGG